MAQANKRRYVFHFDINNTILMKDAVNGSASIESNVSILGTSTLQSLTLNHIGCTHHLQKCLGQAYQDTE